MLRTSVGFATIGIGTSFCGAGLVLLLLLLLDIPAEVGDDRWIVLVCAGGYVLLAFVIGTAWTVFLQRRTVVWFLAGRRPKQAEAARALRIPVDLATVSGTLWVGGAVALGVLTTVFGSWLDAMGVVLAIVLGGLATVGMTYLASERIARPLMSLALAVASPVGGKLPATVLRRLVVAWSLASGVPLFGVLLVVLPPDVGTGAPTLTLVSLAVIGLVVGALGTGLLARGVAAPLHQLRLALDDIARGRRDIAIDLNDASEIGMLQASVNDLASGLAEQERLRDLFGRHVGDDVVRHALEHGSSLSGDVRTVTALFVDVVGSTALAVNTPPEEVVRRLNGLFTDVVRAVDTHGGLVNKFQGDAALCVFGAPTTHADAATAALRAARLIRDSARERGELDLGIGVATGQVFAGQLGTRSRLEYTVIGDAVNEAARLTDQAKDLPGRILAGHDTVDAAAGAERAYWRHHADLHLRGRDSDTRAFTAVVA